MYKLWTLPMEHILLGKEWWSDQTKASVWLTHQHCSLLSFPSHLLLQALTSTCLHLQVWDHIFAELWLLHLSSITSNQELMLKTVDTQWQCASVILRPAHFSVIFFIILSVFSMFIQNSDVFLVCKLDTYHLNPRTRQKFWFTHVPYKTVGATMSTGA